MLDGENRWDCEKCAQKTEAVKYTYLSREPEFLIIHLRRFKIDQGQRVKSENIVRFPTGKLKFTKIFHLGSGQRTKDEPAYNKYTLQSIV